MNNKAPDMEIFKIINNNQTRCKIYSGATIYKSDKYINECNIISQ